MKLELKDKTFLIGEHSLNIEEINSISKTHNEVVVKTSGNQVYILPTGKIESLHVMSTIERVLSKQKNFVRCDKNLIINLNNVKSCTLKQIEDKEYCAKINF